VQLATEHLIAAGYRRIGFLGGRAGPVLDQRLRGYKTALEQARIAFDGDLVASFIPTREQGYDSMHQLLESQPDLRAAVCYNDTVAFGALSALGERGLLAGKDFALMGFDNVLGSAHSNPPLSTIDVQPGELGEQAAAILLSRIENPERPRQLFLAKPRLTLRQSA
jgi:LacI family transcriptional regulator